MEQFSQVVQAACDGALVGMGVLQVLIWNVGTRQKGAFGLLQVALVHQYDSCVQVGRCEGEGKLLNSTSCHQKANKMQNTGLEPAVTHIH